MSALRSRAILFIDDIHNLVPAMGMQVDIRDKLAYCATLLYHTVEPHF